MKKSQSESVWVKIWIQTMLEGGRTLASRDPTVVR